jgi:hypothetical protein
MIRTFDGVAIEFPLRLYLQRVTGTDPPGATASTKGSLHSGVTSFWPAANNTM